MRKSCDNSGRDGSDADTSQDTWSSESLGRKLRLDNSDVRIHFSYSKAHAFEQQQYPPETNTENEKKGKDGEFFSDNTTSRWIN